MRRSLWELAVLVWLPWMSGIVLLGACVFGRMDVSTRLDLKTTACAMLLVALLNRDGRRNDS